MGKFRQYVVTSFILLMLPTLTAAAGADQPTKFCAQMTPANEVPPVMSATTGKAVFQVRYPDNTSAVATALDFDVNIKKGSLLTQMHFHCAPKGVRGSVVVFFAGRHDGGVSVLRGNWVNGTVSDQSISSTGTGTTRPITCNDAQGLPNGAVINSIQDVVRQIQAGNIYAEAHDTQFPTGVIRDQVGSCRDNDRDKEEDDD